MTIELEHLNTVTKTVLQMSRAAERVGAMGPKSLVNVTAEAWYDLLVRVAHLETRDVDADRAHREWLTRSEGPSQLRELASIWQDHMVNGRLDGVMSTWKDLLLEVLRIRSKSGKAVSVSATAAERALDMAAEFLERVSVEIDTTDGLSPETRAAIARYVTQHRRRSAPVPSSTDGA